MNKRHFFFSSLSVSCAITLLLILVFATINNGKWGNLVLAANVQKQEIEPVNAAALFFETTSTREHSTDLICRLKEQQRLLHIQNAAISSLQTASETAVSNQAVPPTQKNDKPTARVMIPDQRLLLHCVTFLQNNYCGPSTNSSYTSCLNENYKNCINFGELNAQQEQWITRVLDTTPQCRACADRVLLGRREFLTKLSDVENMKSQQHGTASTHELLDLAKVRTVLEDMLCEQVSSGAKKQKDSLDSKLIGVENQLQKQFSSCLKKSFKIASNQHKMHSRQCQRYGREVLAIDTLFGKHFAVLPKEYFL